MKNELWAAFTDIENVGIELESLTTLLSYLLCDLSDGAEAVDDNPARALRFAAKAKTFCTMLFAVDTGIEAQLKALQQQIEEGYALVGAIKREEKK